jgi:Lipocalin-like domain
VHTFDADGHFTLIFMRPDLPKVSSGDQTKVTPEEAQAISTGAISSFGTYILNEADKTLSFYHKQPATFAPTTAELTSIADTKARKVRNR